MSIDFIKDKIGNAELEEARRQQNQLLYFTKSSVQKEYTQEYWNNWASQGYKSDNTFLNWVCATFKKDNYAKFVKHLRFPLPSSKLVNNKIKPELSRVFFSEDGYSKYVIRGKEHKDPEELHSDKFTKEIFNRLLFNYNDILIHDLSDTNKAIRYFVCIDDVVAIDSHNSEIERIAFCSSIEIDEKVVYGYTYIDKYQYIFYDKDFKYEPIVRPHDLGECPADYITSMAFDSKDAVRGSVFSELREELEEYVLLKTLQKMTEKNGSIPVITKLQTKEVDNNEPSQLPVDNVGASAMAPTYIDRPKENQGDKVLEAGTVFNAPAVRLENGGLDMSVIQNFLQFHYLPVEAMEYVKERIKEIEIDLIVMTVGDYFEPNQEAQNESQINKAYISKQDKLRIIANEITRIRNISDYKFLALQYGKDAVYVDYFQGSDFFLETQSDIYDLIEKSPNPIESRMNLMRLAKNRSRFNEDRKERDMIMYNLLPYAVKSDFQAALDGKYIDPVTFEYQTRFNYWINLFEANYGDIQTFWNETEATNAERFTLVNNLIIDLINKFLKEQKDERDNGEGNTPTTNQDE